MEELKKQLQEKGYTFFNMKDYPEFVDDYITYKKYVCNAEKNLLHKIDSVRFDGRYLKNHYKSFENSRLHLDECKDSFIDAEKFFNDEYLPYLDLPESSQYWYYGHPRELADDFKKLISNIVNKIYDESPNSLQHLLNLTYYKSGCFLREHQDGKTQSRICAVLVYLNDEDYNIEWGGNIVFERTETVPPIYGNVAILDFKEGNCIHEVKKVVDGYGRFAVLDFVSVGEPINTPTYY